MFKKEESKTNKEHIKNKIVAVFLIRIKDLNPIIALTLKIGTVAAATHYLNRMDMVL